MKLIVAKFGGMPTSHEIWLELGCRVRPVPRNSGAWGPLPKCAGLRSRRRPPTYPSRAPQRRNWGRLSIMTNRKQHAEHASEYGARPLAVAYTRRGKQHKCGNTTFPRRPRKTYGGTRKDYVTICAGPRLRASRPWANKQTTEQKHADT